MTTSTQEQRILATLSSGKTLTSAQARQRGIMRLSARIFSLRSEGHNIVSVPYTAKSGVQAVKYALAPVKAARRSRAA